MAGKTYWVLWTYVANYSERLLEVGGCASPEDAAKRATVFFSDDFHKKATVYVFDQKPMLVVRRGEHERRED